MFGAPRRRKDKGHSPTRLECVLYMLDRRLDVGDHGEDVVDGMVAQQ
jgi:hypothetical protein